MRSALDHLVFDVIKRNPNVATIDPEWFENCAFPLRLRLGAQTTPLPKSSFAHALPGVSDPVFAFIESLQPYYGVGTINNALRFLRELSNIDKHRYLNVARGRVRMHRKVIFAVALAVADTLHWIMAQKFQRKPDGMNLICP